jgi:hypothetical protein
VSAPHLRGDDRPGDRPYLSPIRSGLVDECHLFVAATCSRAGSGPSPNNVRLKFELLDERGFGNGMVYLHHRSRTGGEREAKEFLESESWADGLVK